MRTRKEIEEWLGEVGEYGFTIGQDIKAKELTVEILLDIRDLLDKNKTAEDRQKLEH